MGIKCNTIQVAPDGGSAKQDAKQFHPPSLPFINGDWRTGLLKELKRDDLVTSVSWSPDGRWLCVGGEDK
jgi:WD40 repeat protein